MWFNGHHSKNWVLTGPLDLSCKGSRGDLSEMAHGTPTLTQS